MTCKGVGPTSETEQEVPAEEEREGKNTIGAQDETE
jgi:hypothetical protein